MKTTLAFLSALLLMGTLSCQPPLSPEESSQNEIPASQAAEQNEIRIGEAFDLRFGGTVRIAGENKNLSFLDLLEDSRCAIGLTCVWAGNGEIALELDGQEFMLNTLTDPKRQQIFDLQVELLQLSPYPVYTVQTGKEEYVARLIVVRAEE